MGRKSIPDKDKKKQRQVYLTDGEEKAILKKHDTLTDAIKTTIESTIPTKPLKKRK